MVESIGFPMTASIFGGVILIWVRKLHEVFWLKHYKYYKFCCFTMKSQSGIVTIYFTCCYTAPRKNADDIRGDSLKYRLRRKSLRGSISDSPHNDDDDESGIELNELEKQPTWVTYFVLRSQKIKRCNLLSKQHVQRCIQLPNK